MSNDRVKRQALPKTFKTREFAVNNWVHFAPSGVRLMDVLDYDYWAHVAASIRRHDSIIIIAEDDSFEAELRVTNSNTVGPGAEVRVIRGWLDDEDAVKSNTPTVDDFVVDFNGAARWQVIRKHDKYVVKSGFVTKGEALAHVALITKSNLEISETETEPKGTSEKASGSSKKTVSKKE